VPGREHVVFSTAQRVQVVVVVAAAVATSATAISDTGADADVLAAEFKVFCSPESTALPPHAVSNTAAAHAHGSALP
jgi:hypothetical protein